MRRISSSRRTHRQHMQITTRQGPLRARDGLVASGEYQAQQSDPVTLARGMAVSCCEPAACSARSVLELSCSGSKLCLHNWYRREYLRDFIDQ
jgi:hypothetical protein